MIFYALLYFVLQTAICNGRTEKMAAFTTMAPKMDRSIYKKTAELIHLINSMHNEKDYKKDKNIPDVETDYFSMRHNKEMALKEILKLVQKNYDASKQYKDLPKIRLYYISNPEVLEHFKAIMKQKDKSTYYEESNPNRKLKEILKSLRRQAVFRIDDPASAEKAVPDTQQIVDTIQQNAEDTLKSGKQEFFDDLVGDSRKKEKESQEKDNAWDIITKKYDWNEKDKKDLGGKDVNISEDNKKKSNKKSDNWDDTKDQKDKYDNDDKKIDIWDDWGQDRKKEKWDDVGQDTKKNDWDTWGTNRNKKDDKWDNLGHDKKKDGWNDWGKNKDNKNDKWVDMGQDKNIDFWDAPVKKKDKKKKIDKLEEWERNDKKDSWDDVGQKKKMVTNDDWGQKKDTLDTWGDKAKPKPKKEKIDTKWNESNKRKGYDSKKKEKDRDNQNSWDNWEMTTKQKRKTTKRKSQITYKKINEWDHYVPKVQSKLKRYGHIPAGALGRTSIPFVGKKGIYEDK